MVFRTRILAALGAASSVGACGGQSERNHDAVDANTGGSDITTDGPSGNATATNDSGAAGTSTNSTGSGGSVAASAIAVAVSNSTGQTSVVSVAVQSTGSAPATTGGGVGGTSSACGDEVYVGPPPNDCDLWDSVVVYEQITPEAAADFCGCSPNGYQSQLVCLLPPGIGQTCAAALPPACVAQLYGCGLQQGTSELCGPHVDGAGDNAQCCYVLSGGCPIGRPFIVAGSARLPELFAAAGHEGAGREVAGHLPALEDAVFGDDPLELGSCGLSPHSRAALRDAYSRDIQTEHASVAAFARFVLQCLALGAPADIVADAQRAMADELEHTRLAQRIALAYGAKAVVPGPLDISGCMAADQDLASVAETTAAESCIAETVSALLLFEASQACQSATLKAWLAKMAEDEERHALLGFRFVAWAIRHGGAVVERRVRRVFSEAACHVGFGSVSPIDAPINELRAHGYLPMAERQLIAQRALREVIAPAAAQLASTPLDSQRRESRRPI